MAWDQGDLEQWGLTPALRMAWMALAEELDGGGSEGEAELVCGRVVAEHRGAWEVVVPGGRRRGVEASGRLRHEARGRAELPAVGDWVVVEAGDAGRIVGVLERRSAFVRQAAGRRTEAQVVAANVDTVFVVTAPGADFSPRRLERYRRAIVDGGAEAVVVLNKADLASADDIDALRAEVGRGLQLLALSALDGEGVGGLEPWLEAGSTVALVGSSGVGKSTLVNWLLGSARQATGAVRETDGTGKHTTTYRELVRLPGGALLVDTPGMRELALWAQSDEEAGGEAADPVDLVGAECRFVDCQHGGEQGCAVAEALADGRLTEAQVQAHQQLQRELAYQRLRQDEGAARAEERRWKTIRKQYRARTKASPKGRG